MNPLFSYKFSVEKRPDLEFEILPMKEENHLKAARVSAHTFALTDPLSLMFDWTVDDLYELYTLPMAKKNLKNNLGIICYCTTTKEIAATLFHEELNLDDNESLDERARKLIRCITYAYNQSSSQIREWTQKTKECFILSAITVLPQYQKLGLGPILLDFILFKHSVLKDAKYIIAEILNPNMLRLALRKGFEIFWEKKWEDFKDVKGCEDYEQMDKILETKGYMRTEKLVLVVFDREKYESQKSKTL